METPAYWGISGFPISHSLTPKMFNIVSKYLGLSEVKDIYLEAKTIDEFEKQVSHLEGNIWLSCTTPIKHLIPKYLQLEMSEDINSINQITRIKGDWKGVNTDGVGFLAACRHIGIEPTYSTLRLRGGGSTARSIAEAWAADGGKIILETGRREITRGPWDKAIIDLEDATIAIDLDTKPGGGESIKMNAEIQVSISYDEDTDYNQFAVIMVAAQHLEAWKELYAPHRKEELPSLSLLLKELAITK